MYLITAVVFCFILMLFKKGDIANDLHYLSSAARSITEGIYINKKFFLNNDVFDPTLSFNPFTKILTQFSLLSGYSLIKTWRNLPLIWVPLSLISVYSFSSKMFQNKNAARIIVLIFILHFSGVFFKYFGFTN
mgnify:CR=1 FL=1